MVKPPRAVHPPPRSFTTRTERGTLTPGPVGEVSKPSSGVYVYPLTWSRQDPASKPHWLSSWNTKVAGCPRTCVTRSASTTPQGPPGRVVLAVVDAASVGTADPGSDVAEEASLLAELDA